MDKGAKEDASLSVGFGTASLHALRLLAARSRVSVGFGTASLDALRLLAARSRVALTPSARGPCAL